MHIFRQDNKAFKKSPRGYCVYVAPAFNAHGILIPGMIEVQVAKCASGDNYCKKLGRAMSMSAETQVIRARDLAEFCAVYYHEIYGMDGVEAFLSHGRYGRFGLHYEYLYRYMV